MAKDYLLELIKQVLLTWQKLSHDTTLVFSILNYKIKLLQIHIRSNKFYYNFWITWDYVCGIYVPTVDQLFTKFQVSPFNTLSSPLENPFKY